MAELEIKKVLKEAEVYHAQGLLKQAEQKYNEILVSMKRISPDLPHNEQFQETIEKKIRIIRDELKEIENEDETPQLSEEHQDLIRRIFSYSESKNMAALEGAVALADFGQYEKALTEFQKLLKDSTAPKMIVAKNMLRCHVFLASPHKAMEQIKSWAAENQFSESELLFLREFLENLLKEEDILYFLYDPDVDFALSPKETSNSEAVFEIYSIRVQPDHDSRYEQPVDLDVAYQVGNTFRFHIKADRKDVLSRFNPGDRLKRVQCFSPNSLFNTSGIISNKKRITSGPQKGDYSIELTINED